MSQATATQLTDHEQYMIQEVSYRFVRDARHRDLYVADEHILP